jgi:predicted 3-demethylubiquinone-9 3-methyltransferase (glyoxalase superfamily)
MLQARPFLMFQGDASSALDLYRRALAAEVLELERYGPGGQGAEGTIRHCLFTVAGQEVRCFDSPVKHAFGFTPAISFFLDCESEAEVDRLAGELGENGVALMPPGDYGFSRRFAWVQDRFGVTWQLNFA